MFGFMELERNNTENDNSNVWTRDSGNDKKKEGRVEDAIKKLLLGVTWMGRIRNDQVRATAQVAWM